MFLTLRALFLPAALALCAAGAAAGPVQVTREDCLRLVRHRPGPGTAYTPGRDVRGRPVAPAELPETAWRPGASLYVFNLEVQPLSDEDFEETTLSLGRVEVTPDGDATIDGRPLTEAEETTLEAHCRAALEGGG